MADLMDNYDFIYSHIKNLKLKLAKEGVRDINNVSSTNYNCPNSW